jgi:hypothetical protein
MKRKYWLFSESLGRAFPAMALVGDSIYGITERRKHLGNVSIFQEGFWRAGKLINDLMNPKLSKETIRECTAYRAGRSCVDILLALSLLGLIAGFVLVFGFSLFDRMPNGGEWSYYFLGFCCMDAIGAVILREVAHAIFDMADAALSRHDALAEFRVEESVRGEIKL